MCGILGVVLKRYAPQYEAKLETLVSGLLIASESRGKDATGICQITSNEMFNLRLSLKATRFVNHPEYKSFIEKAKSAYRNEGRITFLGHTRLATHGISQLTSHHQPLIQHGIALSHNGLVINENELSKKLGQSSDRKYESDTELLISTLHHKLHSGTDIIQSLDQLFNDMEGENNLLFSFSNHDALVGYTNTGSLHLRTNDSEDCILLCSEKAYLNSACVNEFYQQEKSRIKAIKPQQRILVGISSNLETPSILLGKSLDRTDTNHMLREVPRTVDGNVERKRAARNNVKRCTRCVLPETMPYISFDANGECNYCQSYVIPETKGEDRLNELLGQYRSSSDKPDCIVALSGGRDSCYGLHLLKRKYGMNPIAFTYDWGVVTSLARRNQARMCEKLGVEHIWIAADFKAKRRNIRKNINAWLKRPELGMVPLFMAGDKEFFVHANRLKETFNLDLMVFSMSPLERTDFKSGFANVNPYRGEGWHYRMDWWRKARLAFYYLKQIAINPGYLNLSLLDSLRAFIAYYFIDQDYLYLFEYADWDEDTINRTLIEEYDWETRSDYTSTWRIGDGTAPFYNYVYGELAGLTENDTLRSNQIRENQINRDDALRFLEVENKPRWAEIVEYCNLIGVDIDEVINSIENAPCRYLDK